MKQLFTLLMLLICAAIGSAVACERYEPPPRPVIEGLASGVLSNSRDPLVIDFGTPIALDTLVLKVVLFETDAEGNLFDEDDNPNTELKVLIRKDPLDGDLGIKVEHDLALSPSKVRLTLDSALPVGPKLVMLVESGLQSSATGRTTNTRIRLPFSYIVKCSQGASKFPNGYYFFLLDVEEPLGTQIQLLSFIDVDPATGALVGQFTNADRNAAQACPTPCPSADVCRLLPEPACVQPSLRAGTMDEWPDFVPNSTPPTGYSFLVQGCAVDDGAATGVLTAPSSLVVESPKVTVEGLSMTASFAASPDGVVRGTGSLTADLVRLGTNPLGIGKGKMTAVRIPDERVPPNVPRPPARSDAGAPAPGGSDAGP